MDAPRHGQEGALALPWKYTGWIRFSYNILVYTKKQDAFHWLSLHCDSRLRELLTALPPDTLARFKRAASQRRRKGRMRRAGRKGGEERRGEREKGRNGEEKVGGVDFASCKNSCGRLWKELFTLSHVSCCFIEQRQSQSMVLVVSYKAARNVMPLYGQYTCTGLRWRGTAP